MYTQRYLEVMKFRGTDFFGGQHPYRVTSQGIDVSPRVNARRRSSIRPPAPHASSRA